MWLRERHRESNYERTPHPKGQIPDVLVRMEDRAVGIKQSGWRGSDRRDSRSTREMGGLKVKSR